MMASTPRAVRADRTIKFENSKNKKNYDEAQKRITKVGYSLLCLFMYLFLLSRATSVPLMHVLRPGSGGCVVLLLK